MSGGSGMTKLEETIQRFESAMEELREVIREAHGANKDLKKTIQEAKQILDGDAQERINKAVGEGLASYADTLKQAMDDGIEHVAGEFAKLGAIYLGTERKNGESLEDLMERYKESQG